MIRVGNDQPLIRAYADIKAIDYLRLVPSDKIPKVFDEPLRRYAYYIPYPTAGIYYLITQCDSNGGWNDKNWQYYDNLSHHYESAIPNFSIILSMTNKCPIVYKKINKQCKDYNKKSNNGICSMKEVEMKFS